MIRVIVKKANINPPVRRRSDSRVHGPSANDVASKGPLQRTFGGVQRNCRSREYPCLPEVPTLLQAAIFVARFSPRAGSSDAGAPPPSASGGWFASRHAIPAAQN